MFWWCSAQSGETMKTFILVGGFVGNKESRTVMPVKISVGEEMALLTRLETRAYQKG